MNSSFHAGLPRFQHEDACRVLLTIAASQSLRLTTPGRQALSKGSHMRAARIAHQYHAFK